MRIDGAISLLEGLDVTPLQAFVDESEKTNGKASALLESYRNYQVPSTNTLELQSSFDG